MVALKKQGIKCFSKRLKVEGTSNFSIQETTAWQKATKVLSEKVFHQNRSIVCFIKTKFYIRQLLFDMKFSNF